MTVAGLTASHAASASPETAEPRRANILNALDFALLPTPVSVGYRYALGALVTGLFALAVIYLAMLAFLTYLVVWHTRNTLTTFGQGPFFIFHIPMALLGAVLLLFMVKPIFFHKRSGQGGVITLREEDESVRRRRRNYGGTGASAGRGGDSVAGGAGGGVE